MSNYQILDFYNILRTNIDLYDLRCDRRTEVGQLEVIFEISACGTLQMENRSGSSFDAYVRCKTQALNTRSTHQSTSDHLCGTVKAESRFKFCTTRYS